MTVWIVILAVGAGSLAFRLGPLLVLRHMALPASIDRAINYAGLATIVALTSTSTRGVASGAPAPTLVAVTAAVALAARRASPVRIIAIGGSLYAISVIAVQAMVA